MLKETKRKGKEVKKFSKNISVYILIFALVISLAYFCKGFMGSDQVSMKEVSFSQFTELVKGEKISEISIEGTTLRGLVSKSSMVYRLLRRAHVCAVGNRNQLARRNIHF